jgi:hypothetical protein
MDTVQYYDLKKNWRKVKKHLNDKKLNHLLVRDMNKFSYGRWHTPFKPGMLPEDIESCDWRFDHRGRQPAYWRYVKHSACHWIVNFTLRLAQLTLPNEEWHIVKSDKHSTVWNGKELLFDFNFQALGIEANECFEMAHTNGKVLPVGKYARCYTLPHYTIEL